MNILWLSWKDVRHPDAGGAERLGHLWRRRLVADGHAVRHLTASYPEAPRCERIDGVETIRRGWSRVTHYPAAIAFHLRHTRTWAHAIIEEVNTAPYLTGALPAGAPVVLLYHQLAREIWFYQTPLPLAALGYAAEALYTWAQSRFGHHALTVSPDSARDLHRLGFRTGQVRIVREAIENDALAGYDPARKDMRFTILFHGSLRAMKRPLDALRAFEAFTARGGDGRLWVSGGGDAGALRAHAAAHGLSDRVTFWGRTSDAQKLDLMAQATVLICTSVKEGWGLVVTESNSMATPAIVYDVDGLRTAAGTANWKTAPRPDALAERLLEAWRVFADRSAYDAWCRQVLEDGRQYTPDASYEDFRAALMSALRR